MKNLGLSIRRMHSSNHKPYLHFTLWYPRTVNRFGYLYWSIRWI